LQNSARRTGTNGKLEILSACVSVPMELTACSDGSALLAIHGREAGVAMKWILVVLVGGMTPIQTDLKFDKLADCLDAEEQLRTTYAEAYAAWDKAAAGSIERRRDYRRVREFQGRRLANTGTCIPHAGTDQVVTVPKSGEPPATTPAQNPAR
jgi:hypothetical protein